MQVRERNIVFDTENPLCKCKITTSQGKLFGFFTFIDWWKQDLKPSKKDTLQYWGEVEWDEEGVEIQGHGAISVESIREVMGTGGKWSKFEG